MKVYDNCLFWSNPQVVEWETAVTAKKPKLCCILLCIHIGHCLIYSHTCCIIMLFLSRYFSRGDSVDLNGAWWVCYYDVTTVLLFHPAAFFCQFLPLMLLLCSFFHVNLNPVAQPYQSHVVQYPVTKSWIWAYEGAQIKPNSTCDVLIWIVVLMSWISD